MSASDRPAPKGPSLAWLTQVVGGLFLALIFSYWVNFRLPSSKDLPQDGWTRVAVLLPYVLIALSVGLALRGFARIPRWLRLRELARQYPYEPWRWEFPQGARLRDEQAAQAAEAVMGILICTGLLLFFTGIILWLIFGGDAPIPVVIFLVPLLSVMGWIIIRRGFIPAVTRILAFMRYGQTRLHLQQFPLTPGSKTQVELIMPRGMEQLGYVRGVVRRVRERRVVTGSGKNRSSDKVQDVEARQPQFINAQEGQNGDTLSFVLTVPPAEPKDSTDLSSSLRCFWELHLTSDVPGLDLDIHFLLPVYVVSESQPAEGLSTARA